MHVVGAIVYGRFLVAQRGNDDLLIEGVTDCSPASKVGRHCERAEEVFGGVVECCREGLVSVERALEETTSIVDEEGEQNEIIAHYEHPAGRVRKAQRDWRQINDVRGKVPTLPMRTCHAAGNKT